MTLADKLIAPEVTDGADQKKKHRSWRGWLGRRITFSTHKRQGHILQLPNVPSKTSPSQVVAMKYTQHTNETNNLEVHRKKQFYQSHFSDEAVAHNISLFIHAPMPQDKVHDISSLPLLADDLMDNTTLYTHVGQAQQYNAVIAQECAMTIGQCVGNVAAKQWSVQSLQL